MCEPKGDPLWLSGGLSMHGEGIFEILCSGSSVTGM
jgi:hypothetical protein